MTALCLSARIGEGQFADVFMMPDGLRVCKLYRAAGTDLWRKWSSTIQAEEIQASSLAANDDRTRDLVPKCFGSLTVSAVTDEHGGDISAKYLLSTGILFEYVHGREEKALDLDPAGFPNMESMMDTFRAIGIDAADASAIVSEGAATLKLIDITTLRGARLVTEVL